MNAIETCKKLIGVLQDAIPHLLNSLLGLIVFGVSMLSSWWMIWFVNAITKSLGFHFMPLFDVDYQKLMDTHAIYRYETYKTLAGMHKVAFLSCVLVSLLITFFFLRNRSKKHRAKQ